MVGGVSNYVGNLSKSLAKLGNEIDIISPAYDDKDSIENLDSITLYKLSCLNIFKKTEEEIKFKSKDFMKFLQKYTNTHKPDVLSPQNFHAAISGIGHTLVLNSIAIEKNIPLILTIHAFPENPGSDLKIALAKNLFWDRINAVSSAVAEKFYNEGINVEKLKVLYPGTDTNVFKPHMGKKWLMSHVEGLNERDIIILHASRTADIKTLDEKGVKTILKAFSLVASQYKNAKLLIASASVPEIFEKEKEEAIAVIKNTAKLYGLQDKVKIKTFEPEEMPLVYNGCDIYAMASRGESFGLVYTEAMACELPVIGTSVGGIPEIIEVGKCGYLVPPDNSVELAKYLSILLSDPKKRKAMGKYGRKVVQTKFELDKISLKRIGNYKSLLYHKKEEKKASFLRRLVKE